MSQYWLDAFNHPCEDEAYHDTPRTVAHFIEAFDNSYSCIVDRADSTWYISRVLHDGDTIWNAECDYASDFANQLETPLLVALDSVENWNDINISLAIAGIKRKKQPTKVGKLCALPLP